MANQATREWYLQDHGRRMGPFSSEEIESMAAAGRPSASAQAWRQGIGAWIPVASVPPPSPAPPPGIGASIPVANVPPPPRASPPPAQTTEDNTVADAWYVSDGKHQAGPHSCADLALAIASGRIPPTAQVWQPGWPAWAPVAQYFPVPSPAPPPARARRGKFRDPLAPIQLILLIIYVASVAVAVKTDNGELATHAGWLLIAIVVLVIVSRVMRWSWNSRQP